VLLLLLLACPDTHDAYRPTARYQPPPVWPEGSQYLARFYQIPVAPVWGQSSDKASFFSNVILWQGESDGVSYTDPILFQGFCHGGMCGGDNKPAIQSYFIREDCALETQDDEYGIIFGFPNNNQTTPLPFALSQSSLDDAKLTYVSTFSGLVPVNEAYPNPFTAIQGSVAVFVQIPKDDSDLSELSAMMVFAPLTVDSTGENFVETDFFIQTHNVFEILDAAVTHVDPVNLSRSGTFDFGAGEAPFVMVPLTFMRNDESYHSCGG
jgi:hypothetical protein